MNEIIMKRVKLLDMVKLNRETHRKVFLEALDGYKKAAIAELELNLADARDGRKFARSLTLIEPMDMTKSYDQAIQMLEMHEGAEITITHEEFRNYVRDEWHWTKQWSASNSVYASSHEATAYLATKTGE